MLLGHVGIIKDEGAMGRGGGGGGQPGAEDGVSDEYVSLHNVI